ncbi:MAG: hypothetical protein U0325_04310 [Polyangiales bacterium]
MHEGRSTVRDLEFYDAFNQEYRPSHWTRNPASDESSAPSRTTAPAVSTRSGSTPPAMDRRRW